MRTATAVALVWMGGSLIVCGGQDPQATPGGGGSAPTTDRKPPYGDTSPIRQDQEVVITVAADGQSLKVKSNDAVIREHQSLRWVVRGLQAGQSVEIDFEVYRSDYRGAAKNVKGPFPRAEHPANPVRGRFVLDDKNPRVESAGSEIPGYFKYHVVLRKGKDDIFALDPGVVVKNDF